MQQTWQCLQFDLWSAAAETKWSHEEMRTTSSGNTKGTGKQQNNAIHPLEHEGKNDIHVGKLWKLVSTGNWI